MIGVSDMGFRTHPNCTVPTLLLHLALSASSFEFKIPIVRIREGSRIWPEYRLHSLVFCDRSLAVMALYWYEDTYQVEKPYYPINAVIVLFTTWMLRDSPPTSLRLPNFTPRLEN